MKKKIRAVQYGVGPIGAAIVRLIREKKSIEIILGQASGAVRGQIHGNFVPRVRPIRMMIHFLGCERDARHESERLREILEFEHPVQLSIHHAPAAKFSQFRGNLLFR